MPSLETSSSARRTLPSLRASAVASVLAPTSCPSRSRAARTASVRSSSPKAETRSVRAARTDGDGKPSLGARDQQEQSPGWRLFQRLQQRIRRVLVQLVGAIDNHHAPASLARRRAEKGAQAPDLVDADHLRIAFRLLDPGAADEEKVRMRQRRDLAKHRVLAIDALAPDRPRPAPCARSDRPASPCRCLRAPRSAMRDAFGRWRPRRRTRRRAASCPNRRSTSRGAENPSSRSGSASAAARARSAAMLMGSSAGGPLPTHPRPPWPRAGSHRPRRSDPAPPRRYRERPGARAHAA